MCTKFQCDDMHANNVAHNNADTAKYTTKKNSTRAG